jgi:hypothetical protein
MINVCLIIEEKYVDVWSQLKVITSSYRIIITKTLINHVTFLDTERKFLYNNCHHHESFFILQEK